MIDIIKKQYVLLSDDTVGYIETIKELKVGEFVVKLHDESGLEIFYHGFISELL